MIKKHRYQNSQETISRLTANEKRVLRELVHNARISDSGLGEKLKISSQAASKIRKKLSGKGVIDKYHLEIDLSSLNRRVFSLVIFDTSIERGGKELLQELESRGGYLRKVYLTTSSYFALLSFSNIKEMQTYFDSLHERYCEGLHIRNFYVLHVGDIIKNCYRNLSHKIIKEFNKEPTLHIPELKACPHEKTYAVVKKLNQNELEVLKHLEKNARISFRGISRILGERGLTDKGIQKIISRLEKRRVIRGYTLKLNHPRMGINVSVLVFLEKKPPCWKLEGGFHRWMKSFPHLTESYRLEGSHTYALVFCFRTLEEMEYYLKAIESQFHQYFSIQQMHFLSLQRN